MKPSQKNRCARTIVRDFLVGLALFLTVFILAMFDSRASHSAPAFFAKPATSIQSTFTPVKISMGALGLRVSENEAADFEESDLILSPPGAREFAGENFRSTFPTVKKKSVLPGSGADAEPPGRHSKLAMTVSKRRADKAAFSPTPTASDRTWMLGVMALIFAVMTALTLGLWRHLRLTVAPRRGGRRV
jgi:hypothetical protein